MYLQTIIKKWGVSYECKKILITSLLSVLVLSGCKSTEASQLINEGAYTVVIEVIEDEVKEIEKEINLDYDLRTLESHKTYLLIEAGIYAKSAEKVVQGLNIFSSSELLQDFIFDSEYYYKSFDR